MRGGGGDGGSGKALLLDGVWREREESMKLNGSAVGVRV